MSASAQPEPATSLKERIRYELQPSVLLPNLTAGVVVGIMVVIVAISIASLIFHGELQEHLGPGIGLALFSGVLITGLIALTSSYPGMVAYPQERVAPILALIATAIVSQMSGHATSEEIFLTVVGALAATALLNGLLLAGLGYFKLGNLIRFIPYPVIGGFLAGTGWLLVKGSLGVMTSIHIRAENAALLFEPAVLPKWAVGAAFGLLLVYITHRFKHYLVMPALLIGGVLVFHLSLVVLGESVQTMSGSGWLLGPFPTGGSWEPLSIAAVQHADWSVIASQWGDMMTVFVIAVVSVLLNSGALELVTKTDIDLNRELRAAGGINVLIGLGGGTVGFHSLAMSRLVHRMGSKSRVVGLVGAAMCGLMLLVGTAPLAYLPRAVLGGLLFFLGMHFLIEWVWEAYHRLTRSDYAVVIMILLIVASMGYLPGVIAGVLACVVLFLVNYSRVDVVKLALTGRDRRSNVDRARRHARILQRQGNRVRIFKLQGFIFFGTANGLFNRVRQLVEEDGARLRFLVFEFKRVTGIDSSSVLSFIKTRQLAETHGFTLIFIGLSREMRRLLDKESFDDVSPDVYRRFDDLDHGLEWCENELLAAEGFTFEKLRNVSFVDQLEDELAGIDADRFREYFERLEIDEGEALIRQGEESDALYVLDQGQVTAELTMGDGKPLRLRTMHSGTIVGEMGLILKEPRSASVVADRPSVVYRLTAKALKRMESEAPDLAASFFSYLTQLMAERLANSNRTVQTVLE